MSFSSKPKKVKPQGTVRELKIVHTVNRRGGDTLKTEEVKTPRHSQQKTPSKSQAGTSSPAKRLRTEDFDVDPIPFNIGDDGISNKRQTLVFLHHFLLKM